MRTIFGTFDDPIAARNALESLQTCRLELDDISLVSRATEHGEAIANDSDVSAGEGAAVGAVWGGLIGLAALLIPGVGPFIAVGAIGAALTGAVAGAVVGGISAALIDFGGITESEARRYEALVHEGKTLVAVRAHDEDANEVQNLLESFGGDVSNGEETDISAPPPAVAVYDEHGRVDPATLPPAATVAPTQTGIYSPPPTSDPYSTRPIVAAADTMANRPIESEDILPPEEPTIERKRWVGEGQGEPNRSDV
jgi:uncharacterized membrane protein